jgi:hypothetical protein
VPEQAIAEGQFPQFAVVFDNMAFQHLRLRRVGPILAVQGVEHHVAVTARDIGGGPVRIEKRQIDLRNEFQGGRAGGAGDGGQCQAGKPGRQKMAPPHAALS